MSATNKKVGISMRISTVGYSAKQGVKNIGRNKMFSLASVATMAACIFVFGLFFSIIMNFQYIVHKAEEELLIHKFTSKNYLFPPSNLQTKLFTIFKIIQLSSDYLLFYSVCIVLLFIIKSSKHKTDMLSITYPLLMSSINKK